MKQMMGLLGLLGMFMSSVLFATQSSLDGLSPIAFTKFHSTMSDDQASKIIESLSDRLRRTMVDVYATELIGSASAFAPDLEPAIIGSSAFAAGEIDRTIELEVMPEISPVLQSLDSDEKIEFDVEVLWADQKTLSDLPKSSTMTSILVAAMRLSGRLDEASLLSMRWVDADEWDSTGAVRNYLKTTDLLVRLAGAKPLPWLPWQVSMHIIVDRTGIRISHESMLLPSPLEKSETLKKPGMTIEKVEYRPRPLTLDSFGDPSLDLVRVSFERYYSVNSEGQVSEVRLVFGSWDGERFRTCMGDRCLSLVGRVPTIYGSVDFTANSWWESVIGWFRSWIVSKIEVKILLQDLRLHYDRNTHRVKVDASLSRIPIVVKTNALFSGDKPFIVDDRTGVFGVNLYQRFVGSQITDGLSADLNNSLQAADKALAALIAGIADGLLR